MEKAKKPMRNLNYRLEFVDGEAMLFDPKGTKILYLNSSASVVWQLCDGTRTIGEIIMLLQDAYPEAKDEILLDVNNTLKEFKENGCIYFP